MRFLQLSGDHHLPQYGDPESLLNAIHEFLGVTPQVAARPTSATAAAPSGAPVALLFTDMEGSTSLTERLGDAAAQELFDFFTFRVVMGVSVAAESSLYCRTV